jgi:LytS/YehU family sensor histidine kinase
MLPYLLYAVLVGIDLFDTRIIYYFEENYNYHGGFLNILPEAVLGFYVILLGFYSVFYISKGHHTRGVIALFMTVTSIVTIIGERVGFSEGFSESVTALEILIYYFFLASIDLSKTQTELFEKQLDLERQRNKLLVAQIQPHFIFNCLATIQALCYTDSESAADCIDVFGDYLRANIDSISSDEFISFSSEIKHAEQYVKLEKISTDVNINVIYELETQDFMIPPLTVQPIVENAVKYGALTRRDGSGFVKIRTEEINDKIRITITDNGIGASLTKKQKEHHSIGIQNVRQRLSLKCGGTLTQNITQHNGAVSVIEIPKITGKER